MDINCDIIISADHSGKIKIWNSETGECLNVINAHSNWITFLCFNYHGTKFLSSSMDRTIKIWKTESSKCLKVINNCNNFVEKIYFNDDEDGINFEVNNDNNNLSSVSYNYDKSKIALVSNKNINIFETENNKHLITLENNYDINFICFIPYSPSNPILK